MLRQLFKLSDLFTRKPNTRSSKQRHRPRTKLVLEVLEDRCVPANVAWDGGGDGIHWSDELNWDTDQLPTAQDDVTINNAAITVVHDAGLTWIQGLSSTANLKVEGVLVLESTSSVSGSLTVDGTLQLTSNVPLELTGGGTFNGTLLLDEDALLHLKDGAFTAADGSEANGYGTVRIGGGGQGTSATLNAQGSVTHDNVELQSEGTISGTGTLLVASSLNVTGGSMVGSGKTSIDYGAAAVIEYLAQEQRLLENQGTLDWNGAPAGPQAPSWTLAQQARLVNMGLLNINTNINRFHRLDGQGVTQFIDNYGQIVQNGTDEALITRGTFANDGILHVQEGTLMLGEPDTSFPGVDNFIITTTGYMEVNLSATVKFQEGSFVFDPNLNDTDTYMLRGNGWFIAQGGTVRIPANAEVGADNFELAGARLSGEGSFAAGHLKWIEGFMQTSNVPGGPMGKTVIESGGRLTLEGDFHGLLDREILNQGVIEWLDGAGEIAISSGGTIITENGGIFDIWTDDQFINNPNNTAGMLIVRNNGRINRHLTQYMGTMTFDVAVSNQGGLIVVDGDTVFSRALTHTDANAITSFGSEDYQVEPNTTFAQGKVELHGGEIHTPLPLLGNQADISFTGADFEGNGRITANRHFLTSGNSRMDLNGDLEIFYARTQFGNSEIHLNGNTLIVAPWTGQSDNNSATIFLEGGTFEFQGSQFNNYGTIRTQSGNFQGPLRNRAGGRIAMGGPAGPNVFLVAGDFEQDTGGILEFDIGGNIPGVDYSQLVVLGHATLGGSIQVNLINGFIPSTDPTPDEFEILVFDSYEEGEQFDETTIDLGNGLHFDIEYNLWNVTLITDEDE